MTAERVRFLGDNPVERNQFWVVAERDDRGYPIRMERVYDVQMVMRPDGSLDHYRVGVHPSRVTAFDPDDVVTTVDLDYYRSNPR